MLPGEDLVVIGAAANILGSILAFIPNTLPAGLIIIAGGFCVAVYGAVNVVPKEQEESHYEMEA